MRLPNLVSQLQGSNRRSIGQSNQVVRLVRTQPKLFRELIACLWSENAVLRSGAADAAEKVSRDNPRLLDRCKSQLLGLLAEIDQIELRWHLAQMIPRLTLTPPERKRAAAALPRYLDDRSSIVRTFALQALVDLSRNDTALLHESKQLLETALLSGTPAMKARAR